MKKLIIITLLFAAFSGEPTSGEAVRPRHTYDKFADFVQDVKKTITFKRPYKIGTEENLVLAPGRAANRPLPKAKMGQQRHAAKFAHGDWDREAKQSNIEDRQRRYRCGDGAGNKVGGGVLSETLT